MARGAYDQSVDQNGIVARFNEERAAREEAIANAPAPKATRRRRNSKGELVKRAIFNSILDTSATATNANAEGQGKAGVDTGKKA